MLPSETAHEISWQHRGIAEWLFHRTGEVLKRRFQIGINDELLVVGPKFMRNNFSVRAFVKIRVLEPDGKCFDWLGGRSRHQRHDDRRICASAQQSSQWNVRNQPDAYRLCQSRLHFLETLLFGFRRMCS